jgi:argininosuccinate lyase
MSLEAYRAIGGVLSGAKDPFEADVYQVFDPMKSIEKRNAIGGTSLRSIRKQISLCRNHLQT